MIRTILKACFFTLMMVTISSCEKTIELLDFGIISGQVLDAKDNTPVAGVSITTAPASSTVITDAEGRYKIEEVPVGEIIVTAKKMGYKQATASLNLQAGKEAIATIVMEKSAGYFKPGGTFKKPAPINAASQQLTQLMLSWSFEQNTTHDSLFFDVKLFESSSTTPVNLAKGITDFKVEAKNLKYATTYYWQVVASDQDSIIAYSELWSFTTSVFPDNPLLFSRATDGIFDIYTIDTLGGGLLKLTNGKSNINWYPRINRIVNRVAFVSNRDFDSHIYTMNLDGGDIRKVTSLPITGNYNSGTGFCWSVDGSKLLYPHYNSLYLINADGTGLTQFATAPAGRNFTFCDWSTYTHKIVVQTTGNNPYDNEIYLMNDDGSGMELFVDNMPGVLQNPVFSVDGTKVMFTQDLDGLNSPDGRQLNAHIMLKSVSDNTITDLSQYKEDGTNDLMPRFSPDGAFIVYVNKKNTTSGVENIMFMRADGTKRKLVTTNGTMPEWK